MLTSVGLWFRAGGCFDGGEEIGEFLVGSF
jgi:hypothetical protein